MQRIAKLIFNRTIAKFILTSAVSGGLLGCVSSPRISDRGSKTIAKASNQKVFYYSYDLVWRAAQLSLRYPIAVNNMDNGNMETENVKLVDGFLPPHQEAPTSTGAQYKIVMTLVKGKVDGRDGVRVTVNKNLARTRDFFSEPEALVSDGLEERAILYRMDRELIIDEAIKKAQTKGQL